jgi:hypothetical protein
MARFGYSRRPRSPCSAASAASRSSPAARRAGRDRSRRVQRASVSVGFAADADCARALDRAHPRRPARMRIRPAAPGASHAPDAIAIRPERFRFAAPPLELEHLTLLDHDSPPIGTVDVYSEARFTEPRSAQPTPRLTALLPHGCGAAVSTAAYFSSGRTVSGSKTPFRTVSRVPRLMSMSPFASKLRRPSTPSKSRVAGATRSTKPSSRSTAASSASGGSSARSGHSRCPPRR